MQPNQPFPQGQTNPQDPLRISRRQLDPEDVLEIARRNKSWIAGPILAGLVIAVVVAFLWPDTYVSAAVIRVVPPQVPASFVPSNVATQMSQRINSMAQTILSRGTLTSIIETYGLYARQRQSVPLEDVIEQMKKDIRIGQVRNIQPTRGDTLTAFHVSFSYENRYLAQKVTGDLVTRFINQNTRDQATQSAMTTQFLKDQWQAAKNDLDTIEQKLTEFRIRNAGQLPDQWAINMQQSNALEARIASLNGAVTRLNQEKLVLESQVRVLRDQMAAITKAPGSAPLEYVDAQLALYDQRIRTAERTLTGLLEQYTSNHPDVKRFEGQIELLRKEREQHLAERTKVSPESPGGPMVTPAQAAELRKLNAAVQDKEIQIRAKQLDIDNNVKQIHSVSQRIQEMQKRLEAAPFGQQEYTDLIRDYELAKQRYNDLNAKKSQSEIATDLENRKQGETLELLDPASLPEKPTEPVRSVIVLLGVFLGSGLGGVLAFLREMKDASLKTLKDVRAYTQLAVLGSIPLLEDDLVVMRRRRMTWLAWTTACVFAAVMIAGSIYYYYVTKV